MESRKKILEAIKTAGVPEVPLPAIDTPSFSPSLALRGLFASRVEAAGGQFVLQQEPVTPQVIQQIVPDSKSFACTPNTGIEGTYALNKTSPHEYTGIDVFVCKAGLGVAENGGVWLSETEMVDRVLPFISEHVIILLDEKALVPSMHHAYDKIGSYAEGFGLFLAGPSKTADIEQSLVIGAHGARSYTLLLNPLNPGA